MTSSTFALDVPSDLGTFSIVADDRSVTEVHLPTARGDAGERTRDEDPPDHLRDAAHQLTEYLQGRRTSFDVPLAAEGTDFQRAVWFALAGIPYGETISYAELAETVGRPRAYRAVGQANGRNPLPVFLPCHRVVASGGGIGGYGGGLDLKRALLDLECGAR